MQVEINLAGHRLLVALDQQGEDEGQKGAMLRKIEATRERSLISLMLDAQTDMQVLRQIEADQ